MPDLVLMAAEADVALKEILLRMDAIERKIDLVLRKVEALEEDLLTEEDIKELEDTKKKIMRGDYSDFIPVSDVRLD